MALIIARGAKRHQERHQVNQSTGFVSGSFWKERYDGHLAVARGPLPHLHRSDPGLGGQAMIEVITQIDDIIIDQR